MADAVPVVYVEANWVVAHVLPHDDDHKAAVELLRQATRGDCELRIPRVAELESRSAVKSAAERPFKSIETARNFLAKAYRNGVTDLNIVDTAFNDASVRSYLGRDNDALRVALLADRAVTIFSDAEAELPMMDTLSSLVRFDGMNVKDFYILASILVDRTKGDRPPRPAIFFSTNRKEFEPGVKTPQDFYTRNRLLWRPDFQLMAALKDWKKAFPAQGGVTTRR